MNVQSEWRRGVPLSLQTERFHLRSLTADDVTETYLRWFDDADVVRFLNSGSRKRSREDIAQYIMRHDNDSSFHLGIFSNANVHIGNYSIHCDYWHGVAQTSVLIGDRDWWRKKVVVETRAAILDFLFNRLGMEKVCGTPYAKNVPAIYNYQIQGFSLEGTLRSHRVLADGQRCDVLCFAMFRKDWLTRRRIESV